MTSAVGALHERLVFGRRTRVLARHIGGLIPPAANVLDVGCGDGTIDALILKERTDLSIRGVDVLVRPRAKIAVESFDGKRLPTTNKSYDVVMFVDVLHHTEDPLPLLQEANRVARRAIIVKDHTRDGPLAYSRLRFMDWVGNAHHNVVLPYNYWSERQWRDALSSLDLRVLTWQSNLGLYPFPLSIAFGAGLHCLLALEPAEVHQQRAGE